MNTITFQIIDIFLMLDALALIVYGIITNRRTAIAAPAAATEGARKLPKVPPYLAMTIGAIFLILTVLAFQPGVLMGIE